jgi:hypothetical protein
MRSLRVSLIISVLAILLLPVVVLAAGPFYTSTTGKASGSGSAVDPRRAENATELDSACQDFGKKVDAGATATVYWVLKTGNSINYFKYSVDSSGKCTPVGALNSGAPPGFGVDLTPPIIVGGLIALGVLLLAVALLLRRRLRAR